MILASRLHKGLNPVTYKVARLAGKQWWATPYQSWYGADFEIVNPVEGIAVAENMSELEFNNLYEVPLGLPVPEDDEAWSGCSIVTERRQFIVGIAGECQRMLISTVP